MLLAAMLRQMLALTWTGPVDFTAKMYYIKCMETKEHAMKILENVAVVAAAMFAVGMIIYVINLWGIQNDL